MGGMGPRWGGGATFARLGLPARRRTDRRLCALIARRRGRCYVRLWLLHFASCAWSCSRSWYTSGQRGARVRGSGDARRTRGRRADRPWDGRGGRADPWRSGCSLGSLHGESRRGRRRAPRPARGIFGLTRQPFSRPPTPCCRDLVAATACQLRTGTAATAFMSAVAILVLALARNRKVGCARRASPEIHGWRKRRTRGPRVAVVRRR